MRKSLQLGSCWPWSCWESSVQWWWFWFSSRPWNIRHHFLDTGGSAGTWVSWLLINACVGLEGVDFIWFRYVSVVWPRWVVRPTLTGKHLCEQHSTSRRLCASGCQWVRDGQRLERRLSLAHSYGYTAINRLRCIWMNRQRIRVRGSLKCFPGKGLNAVWQLWSWLNTMTHAPVILVKHQHVHIHITIIIES